MNKKSKKIILVAFSLFFVSVAGCTFPAGNGNKPPENKSVVQSKEKAQAPPPAAQSDPVKIAESENFFQQGLKLYEQYKYPEAVASFDRAIAADPANFKVYTAKGIARCFEGDYQSGMALIQKTLDLNPGYVAAFYDMAMAYKLQNDYDQSLVWFEKTIQGDPANTWSYYGVATIYADRGNAPESLKYLKKAIELDPAVKAVAQEQDHFAKMRKMPEFQALVR
ncbi:MAG TPA: tetratricopeptide repeat protein [Patescibacteria group bacterium]|nr:tetratricopeptide repeat protein [Patescibacteria group bacterium]